MGQSTTNVVLDPEPLEEPVYMCDDDDGLITKPAGNDTDDGRDKCEHCMCLLQN